MDIIKKHFDDIARFENAARISRLEDDERVQNYKMWRYRTFGEIPNDAIKVATSVSPKGLAIYAW